MIDLLVVNHQTLPLLQRLVVNLHADYRDDVWRLFITDNGSTDGTEKWLLSCCYDHPTYTGATWQIAAAWCNENVGYAAACNHMAKNSYSPIMGFLNADVWLTTRDVMGIQAIFDSDPTIAILGPKQRDEKGRVVHAGVVGTDKKPEHRGWKTYDPADVRFVDRVDCVTVSGSAYFIRRSVWDELCACPIYQQSLRSMGYEDVPGAFLPTKHYYEETWCSYHARAHQHRVVYDGRVSIGHSWHASSQVGGSADKWMRSSQELFRMFCTDHGIECD